MKNAVFIFLLVLTITSCQTLQFDRYPGKEEAEFPVSVRGKFAFINNDLQKDTLTILVEQKSITQIENGQVQKDSLDASHVYSVYKGQQFYFQKNESNYWSGFLISNQDSDLIITPFLINNNESNNDEVKVLKKYFSSIQILEKVDSSQNQNYYIKMNEEELLQYSRKIKKQRLLLKRF